MYRSLAALAATTAVLLTGCSSSGSDNAAADADESMPSATTTSAAPTTESRLGEVDVHTCQSFVADAGEEYGWLTTLEQEGTISGDLGTPGYLEVYNLGGRASVFTGQEESAKLKAAMRDVEENGLALREAIDAQGSVSPTPLRQALDDAADVCQAGGFVIDWYEG